MSNTTTKSNEPYGVTCIENYVWLIGITLSAVCLIIQAMLFIFRPNIRKIDQKILTQLTVARFINTIIEHVISNKLFHMDSRLILFTLYLLTDVVLVSWMFVFTKNLYDKLVLVFVQNGWNFLRLSLFIWLLALPFSLIYPVLLELDKGQAEYSDYFYKAYAVIKFIVMFVNLLFFFHIFYVIINRNRNINNRFISIIKTCIISFILVCITSVQILLTDLTSFFTDDATTSNAFCLINSYQAIAITAIFVILVKTA